MVLLAVGSVRFLCPRKQQPNSSCVYVEHIFIEMFGVFLAEITISNWHHILQIISNQSIHTSIYL